ncbi:RING-H2 finger protein ATL80-like [Aristolochia californica]|uniref:RING-H2 finger protein ATL80-like n=1 Tax=Aristolochia californica TaxID=171875 RepID=UPI0035E16267
MPSATRFLYAASSSPAAPPPDPAAMDSDVVVILAALLCALICVVGLALVGRCAWIRRSPPTQGPRNKGLKKKILKSLPKIMFTKSASGKLVDCAICLAEFVDGDEIRVLQQCGHGYHVGCIDTWLGSHSSCPSCRQILVVARCQECGGIPGTETEGEVKAGEDDVNSSDRNSYNPDSI